MNKLIIISYLLLPGLLLAQTTQKPALHGKHWMAITGKPLAATTLGTVGIMALFIL